MIELISALCKAAGQLSLAWIIGSTVFFWLGGASADDVIVAWKRRAIRFFPIAAVLLLVATAIGIAAQVAVTAQVSLGELFQQLHLLQSFAFETRAGRISSLRLATTLPLLVICILYAGAQNLRTRDAFGVAALIFAVITAVLGPMTGHTAGNAAVWLTPVHIAHVLAICIWLGGLPAWIWLVLAAGRAPGEERCRYVTRALHRFSYLAMICMLIIIASGTVLSLEFVTTQGELLATRYGALICGKVLLLCGVLAIANHARMRLLPNLNNAANAHAFYPQAARWIALELFLAALILGLGAWLAQTTPALHDQPAWWLPYRFSIDATWPVAPTPLIISICIPIMLAAGAVFIVRYKRLSLAHRTLFAAAGILSGSVLLWSLSVPAFPDTYRRSGVPYLTVSIAKGMDQFEPHCSSCHGLGGLGDGVDAATLPKPPADLSAPHTALHTSGDMFWWLTHGIPESGMPGFAGVLDEQDRWDMINFLRTFSQGSEARIISPVVAPNRPWLAAPNFYFENAARQPQALQDFRGVANILLVFATVGIPESGNRLDELTQAAQTLRNAGVEILVISDPEAWQAYELLSRTLSNRGSHRSIGLPRTHMEFLIDRFGYIRARWIPEDENNGWQDINSLIRQSELLWAEPQILPPPSDHVH